VFGFVSQEGERVTPTDLLNHRANHDFRAPCCLCADVSSIHAAGYTESDIYIADNGPYSGEYVAGCASKSCGYLVCIERMYARRDLLLRRYTLRPAGPVPPPVMLQNQKNMPMVTNARSISAFVPMYERPVRGPETALDLLLRLDAWGNPGLSEFQFKRLFARCRCGMFMTRRVFKSHICAAATTPVVRYPAVVIDLTLDSSDSSSDPDVIDLTVDA